MAAAIWIVRKNQGAGQTLVDGIDVVFTNQDDLDVEATVLSETEAALQAAGVDIPNGYFDSAALALSAGNLDADEDLVHSGGRVEVLA